MDSPKPKPKHSLRKQPSAVDEDRIVKAIAALDQQLRATSVLPDLPEREQDLVSAGLHLVVWAHALHCAAHRSHRDDFLEGINAESFERPNPNGVTYKQLCEREVTAGQVAFDTWLGADLPIEGILEDLTERGTTSG